jgi:hypothetical protein
MSPLSTGSRSAWTCNAGARPNRKTVTAIRRP